MTSNHLPMFCYSAPGYTSTLTRKQLKETLLATDGRVFCQGMMCDIKSKHIGAGVYRVWLAKQS
jgi:hypothetical protein